MSIDKIPNEKKYALVTGASSGIGLESAKIMAARGYSLVLVARRRDRLEALKKHILDRHDVAIEIIDCDLAQADAAYKIFSEVRTKEIVVDVLINNAGVGQFGSFLNADLHDLQEMLTLNINSLTQLTHYFGREMRQRRHGYILLVSSVGAFQPCPDFATYAASKAYVLSLGEALSCELKPHGIQVTTLYPGLTRTEFFDVMGRSPKAVLLKSALTPLEVAQQGITALFRGRSGVTTGLMNRINGVLIRFFPRHWASVIAGHFRNHMFESAGPVR